MHDWLVLAASLPAKPSGLRVRVWRSLKATGCAALRDGVYLLPASAASATEVRALEQTIRESGADAHLLCLKARDAAQEKAFIARFDRSAQYAEFAQSLKLARASLAASGAADLRKSLRVLDQQLQSLVAIDFFPGKKSTTASAGLATLRAEVERRLSPGEPRSEGGRIERLRKESFLGKTWATRKRPWVDRLATAWLIRRRIDPAARIVWLDAAKKCPASALGFDFDGARFTHVGDKVTFEVVTEAFGLGDDAALKRLGELVHFIDVGGIPVDEAAGVETLVRGLQAQHQRDDDLLAAALPLFDSLHAALSLRR